jgi:histidinol dehydrogenase
VIRRLDTRALGIDGVVRALDRPPASVDPAIRQSVTDIVSAVRDKGDEAVLEFTERFDRVALRADQLRVTADELDAAERAIGADTLASLRYAADRIARFHESCSPRSWRMTDGNGSRLGQEVRPLDRVAVYVPGGRAAYPSTVLMTVVPARVAGVREIVLLSPPRADGSVIPAVLAAARVAGVTEIYRVGGAQAIAAAAYGTETIRRVDKIVGPGNIYVACAKRLVSGHVKIDGIAGPSEILVVADRSADPRVVAADLLSQAEHDEDAYPLLLTDDAELAEAVAREVEAQLETLPRKAIARAAVDRQGKALVVDDRDALAAVADRIAAEHLALHVVDPEALLDRIDAAGAAFIGAATPEAVGDYVAGPSHVLPTGGAVRFGAPLGVYDFVTRTSIVRYDEATLRSQADAICTFARLEGLEAHARAVEVRFKK